MTNRNMLLSAGIMVVILKLNHMKVIYTAHAIWECSAANEVQIDTA